jgi:hypothetical protein
VNARAACPPARPSAERVFCFPWSLAIVFYNFAGASPLFKPLLPLFFLHDATMPELSGKGIMEVKGKGNGFFLHSISKLNYLEKKRLEV